METISYQKTIRRYNFAVGNIKNVVRVRGNYKYVKECCNELKNLVGLKCVKVRIHEITGQLIVNRFRKILCLNKKLIDEFIHHIPINEEPHQYHGISKSLERGCQNAKHLKVEYTNLHL